MIKVNVLATDLDGTLIPLDHNNENVRDLKEIQRVVDRNQLALLFVTGRHFSSVVDAISEYTLPQPDWIICDVGTTMLRRGDNDQMFVVGAYHDTLAKITQSMPIDQLAKEFWDIRGLRKQEPEKQGPFKLSYYADRSDLDRVADEVSERLGQLSAPYSLIHSVDPFNNDGLIDLLPEKVSKAFALRWWTDSIGIEHDAVVFAGDSGNDLAALIAGYQTIVVSNAADEVIDHVRQTHLDNEWEGRLFLASHPATSGVLEGLKHFIAQPNS